MRLFDLFKGPHWTLLAYQADRHLVAPRSNLHIHLIGERGDILDAGNHLANAYGMSPGDWLLVRPDGYVGALVSAGELAQLESYLKFVGLGRP